MNRRAFITLIGGTAATWPLPARAQQSAMPVIGFLHGATPGGYAPMIAAFRKSLSEASYSEAQNVTIEFRWAEEMAARTLGLQIRVLHANTEREIETVFASLPQVQAGGLVIGANAFFFSRRDQLVGLATRYSVPTVYPWREAVVAGGLMSYGANVTDAYRLAGNYTGRILKGEKPADLPVQQSTNTELVINLKTAKSLGLTFPNTLLARADEVIE
jgi:ABC-type uncharacterized transport system substrate-binding protein